MRFSGIAAGGDDLGGSEGGFGVDEGFLEKKLDMLACFLFCDAGNGELGGAIARSVAGEL